MTSRGSKRRCDFEIFTFPAEPPGRPKPAPSPRPRHTMSVREPPTAKGKLTTAQRLKMLLQSNGKRLTNSDIRQKLEKEKALAVRQILVRRKEDPNLVYDLTRDAPLGNQSNAPTQPDELVSDDDEDDQDFACPPTARTLFPSTEPETSPRKPTRQPSKLRRKQPSVTELSDDENIPRSRLKKRRLDEPRKRVSIPASSSVFAPNIQAAMRAAKPERRQQSCAIQPPREPLRAVNRQEGGSQFSSADSTWNHRAHARNGHSQRHMRLNQDYLVKTTKSRDMVLNISTIPSSASDVQEVHQISDDEDFAGSHGPVKKKVFSHQEASVFGNLSQHPLKRPRPTKQEDRKISTSTFYGSKDGRKQERDSISSRKGRTSSPPSDGIAGITIKDRENSRVMGPHEGRLDKRERKHVKGKIRYESSDDDNESVRNQINPRFKPLSGPELEVVRSLTFKVSKNKVMARIPEARIELKAGDFSGLRGSRWLNDEIMNSFVALINARNRAQVGSTSNRVTSETDSKNEENDEIMEVAVTSSKPMEVFRRPRPRTHVFNTFFFTRLSQHGYDYTGVRRWLNRAGRKVNDLDLIMFPINLSNFHWVLAAIDLRGKQFLYLDSTFGKDSYDTIPLLRRWLHDEIVDKDGERAAAEMQIDTWGIIVNPTYLPQQRDDGSCGIFTLYMAEYLERGRRPDFTQDNIRTLRQRTALFLKRGKLPDC